MAVFFQVNALSLMPQLSQVNYELSINIEKQKDVKQQVDRLNSIDNKSDDDEELLYDLKEMDEAYEMRKTSLEDLQTLLKSQIESYTEGAKEKNKKDGKGGW